MNSEELEVSLRTEFESYLNSVLAEMRQEVSEFQEKFQSEFDKHKAQLDEIFQEFTARLANDKQLDEAFRESVVEHLRLAKDEGARITASAIAEAEQLEKENTAPVEVAAAAPPFNYSEIRDAINEISSQDSQAGILKALVSHAEKFTPRGAFFIIKNEYFVGWRVFGEVAVDEQTVREIFFPMSDETIFSEAVRSLSAVESSYGTYADDSTFLEKLEFGQPESMYAIPLIARGRGVAVLYADYGTEGGDVKVEALETLVRIAGLTVELLAASQGVKAQSAAAGSAQSASAGQNSYYQPETEMTQATGDAVESESEAAQAYEVNSDFDQAQAAEENYEASPAAETEYEQPQQFESENAAGEVQEFQYEAVSADWQPEAQQKEVEFEPVEEKSADETYEPVSEPTYSWSQPEAYSSDFAVERAETEEEGKAYEYSAETSDYAPAESGSSFEYMPNDSTEEQEEEAKAETTEIETPEVQSWQTARFEAPQYDNSAFETAPAFAEPAVEYSNGKSAESFAPEAVEIISEPVPAPPVKTRLSERNVDLPIEVAEEERRLHNDARRFARLLVSEIKLYNEQKVKEGRESSDLYDRLREAIDRSREMYDKRVQPPVASKFDYFHYELVNNLAEGDPGKLGRDYQGSTV